MTIHPLQRRGAVKTNLPNRTQECPYPNIPTSIGSLAGDATSKIRRIPSCPALASLDRSAAKCTLFTMCLCTNSWIWLPVTASQSLAEKSAEAFSREGFGGGRGRTRGMRVNGKRDSGGKAEEKATLQALLSAPMITKHVTPHGRGDHCSVESQTISYSEDLGATFPTQGTTATASDKRVPRQTFPL